MEQMTEFSNKVHGRVYNKPFFIIKHETGEIYRISDNLLNIFNQRERYAEAKFVRTKIHPETNYELNFADKEWQDYLNWENDIKEPVSVSLEPSELYFMSYNIVNAKKKDYVTHIYLLDPN